MKRVALVFCLTTFLGYLAGQFWTHSYLPKERAPTGIRPGGENHLIRERSSRTPKLSVESFMERVKAPATRADTHPLESFLSEWSDAQIRSALDECIADPLGNGLPSTKRDSPFPHLIAEWMRRDSAAVVTWFHELESDGLKVSLLDLMVENWPGDKAEEGFSLVSNIRLPKDRLGGSVLFGSGSFTPLRRESEQLGRAVAENALQHAAGQGVAEVNTLLAMMRAKNVKMPYSLKLPSGFDFVALAGGDEFRTLFEKGETAAILNAWKTNNRDEAFRWVRGNASGKAMASFLDIGGILPDYRWIGSKFADLSKEERSLVIEDVGPFCQTIKEELEGGIVDPALKVEMTCNFFRPQSKYSSRPLENTLAEWATPEDRLVIMENVEASLLVDDEQPQNIVRGHTEAELRGFLNTWTTDQERIESIIRRFK